MSVKPLSGGVLPLSLRKMEHQVPVSFRVFWTETSRKTKEKLAFLCFVLLPLGFGTGVFFLAALLGVALTALKKLDLHVALLLFPNDKLKVLNLLREAGRAEEALAICGNDFHERILSLRALSKVRLDKGDKIEALRALEEAYSLLHSSPYMLQTGAKKPIDEKDYEKTMDLAETINDLATQLQEQPEKDRDRIASLFEESIKLGSSTVGKEDPRVTLWLVNLGIFKQQETGKLNESLEHFEEVLQIRKRILGDEDPLVAKWMVEMAYLLLSRPDAVAIGSRIEELVQGALAIRRKIFGNDHVDVASSLNDCALMAALTAKEGDDSGLLKAVQYGKESADTYERVLGPNHPTTRKARADWG